MSLVLTLMMACTPDNEISRRSTTDVFLQEPLSEVDILWVIDDSNSMAEEQLLVADGFEAFISSLAETNIDFHVGVVSTDMDLSNASRGVLLGNPTVLTDSQRGGFLRAREQLNLEAMVSKTEAFYRDLLASTSTAR